jgi:hypothetical protein
MLNGTLLPSTETRLVYDYFNRKMLRKIGYSFDPCALSDFDVQVYNAIECEIENVRKEESNKSRMKK